MNKIPYVKPWKDQDILKTAQVFCSTRNDTYDGKVAGYPSVGLASAQCCAFMFANGFDGLSETSFNCMLGQIAKVGRVCYAFVTERQQPAWNLFKTCPWARCIEDVPTRMLDSQPKAEKYRVRMYTISVPKTAIEGLE